MASLLTPFEATPVHRAKGLEHVLQTLLPGPGVPAAVQQPPLALGLGNSGVSQGFLVVGLYLEETLSPSVLGAPGSLPRIFFCPIHLPALTLRGTL